MIKIWTVQVIDYMFINWWDVLAVKAIDTITKDRHLYIWSPYSNGMSDLHSERDWVISVVQRWQKFKWLDIEKFLSWFTYRPDDIHIPITTEGE